MTSLLSTSFTLYNLAVLLCVINLEDAKNPLGLDASILYPDLNAGTL